VFTTKLFLITLFSAIVGVIPPGLVNMTVAKTCLERGKRSGFLVAIGASFTVFFQALVAVQLSKILFKEKWIVNVLLQTGFVLFLGLGIYFFIKAQKRAAQKRVRLSEHGPIRSFLKGAMISFFNILPIPYFCAIAITISAKGIVEFNLYDIIVFISAAALGTYMTLHAYAYIFLKIRVNEIKFAKISNYIMSGLMAILMIITVIRMIKGE